MPTLIVFPCPLQPVALPWPPLAQAGPGQEEVALEGLEPGTRREWGTRRQWAQSGGAAPVAVGPGPPADQYTELARSRGGGQGWPPAGLGHGEPGEPPHHPALGPRWPRRSPATFVRCPHVAPAPPGHPGTSLEELRTAPALSVAAASGCLSTPTL